MRQFLNTFWVVLGQIQSITNRGLIGYPQAGVQLLVWSALEDVRRFPDVTAALKEVSPGRFVAHFETKGEITVS